VTTFDYVIVGAGSAAAFVRTRPEIPRPDAQIYFINFSTARRGGVLHPFSGFTLSVSQKLSGRRVPHGWGTCLTGRFRPCALR
jgi:choline dehydrogenase-like flavoprotein